MVIKGKRPMERFNVKILIAALSLFLFVNSNLMAGLEGSDTINIQMKDFIQPQYDQTTRLLQYILYGDYAVTEGAVIKVTNARIDFMGPDGKTVTATLSTPELFYNQTTGFISGNKALHYTSEGFDADGVGFDASKISELLHVRKDVKLLIKSYDESQNTISFGLGDNYSETQPDTGTVLDTSVNIDTSNNIGD